MYKKPFVGFSYFVVCQSPYQSHKGHMTHCPETVCAQNGASYRTKKERKYFPWSTLFTQVATTRGHWPLIYYQFL